MLGLKKIWKALKIVSQGTLLLLLFGFVEFTSHDAAKHELGWSLQLSNLGTLSSPRVSDLTGDGILDIVLGAGGVEFEVTDTGILAVNGKSGQVLWKIPATDQIYGSPSFLDITGDGVDDAVIGGRSSTLQAISGKDGALVWDFLEANQLKDQAQINYFNFYNSQLVPDLSGDGLLDLIVTNGGDVNKKPFDPDRPAGKILVLDSSNGKILHEVTTPDKKETYHSITLSNHSTIDEIQVVFGTGGETIGGSLFLISLKDIRNGRMEKAQVLAESKTNGFIAPVVWIDLTQDGVEDIVANAVEGMVYAIDGSTKKQLWKVSIPGTEIYSSPAVGQFTEDQIPDVFVNASSGVWPDFTDCNYSMIDGAKGKVKYAQRFGIFQSTSPLVIDTDSDGIDEVLISDNRQRIDAQNRKTFYTTLSVIDFKQGGIKRDLLTPLAGNNISSTPWMGDLDGDKMLDIVFCHSNNLYHTFSFDGFRINLLKTDIPITSPLKWGAYMGSKYTGRN
jgi:hypothetical protein